MNSARKPSIFDIAIATGFGSGFWPWGPGTAGAAMATLMWIILSLCVDFTYLQIITAVCVIVFTLASIAPINRLEGKWGEDPSKVVVDEMVGVWICLLAIPSATNWYYIAAAFCLFRILDIIKPLGIRYIDDNIKGGWGVMLDDILAGVYGAIIILIARAFI